MPPNTSRRVSDYTGPERRKEIHFSEEQMDSIAERAAERAMQKLTDEAYKSIGKGLISRLFWVVGVLATAAYFWAQGKGLIK